MKLWSYPVIATRYYPSSLNWTTKYIWFLWLYLNQLYTVPTVLIYIIPTIAGQIFSLFTIGWLQVLPPKASLSPLISIYNIWESSPVIPPIVLGNRLVPQASNENTNGKIKAKRVSLS